MAGRHVDGAAIVKNLSRTTWCVLGTATEPTRATTDATRMPDAAIVQITSPGWSRSTATGPTGVSISVPRARQIGHASEHLFLRGDADLAGRASTVPWECVA